MTDKQKLNKFLKLQDKGVSIDEIAINLGVEVKELRRFLNKHGYKSIRGKYIKKEVSSKQLEIPIKSPVKNTKAKKGSNSKKLSKVNFSSQDLDKLCEVYDWYLSVKDIKALRPKARKNKKDILIEKSNIKDFKSTRIKVEKSIWEEFERLCSNSSYEKHEIITQALKEFLSQYKDLI